MAKVITGAGLQEFIESGKHETLPDKPEIKPAEKAAPPPQEKAETPAPLPPPIPAEDEGLEPDDIDLTEHVRKKINKKHRQMKEAQEAQADAEAFAKNQYDRARLAEERASALEKELTEAKKVPPKEPELKKPDIKDFTDDKGQVRWTDFTEASADFAAKKAVADERVRQAQEREQQEKTRIESQFKSRVDAAVKKYPDFHEAIGKSEAWLPNAVLQYITESEYGPDVSYHLATHPETVDRISKLPPIKAIAEIGKLELTFEKPPVKEPEPPKVVERGGAPPPITPLSSTGTGTVNTDPSKMSFRELRDYERAKRKKH
jgi:hypothetical protein